MEDADDLASLDARDYPVLYSFRRCPYAMRARMGLHAADIQVEFREIILRDKPDHMIAISPKATVPVLQLPAGDVIDESFDIMLWALAQNDPEGLLPDNAYLLEVMKEEVATFDHTFKRNLDRYKYPNRFEGEDALENREAGLAYLKRWDDRLSQKAQLFDDKVLLGDVALFPFVRQFANVDREWFDDQPISNLHRWLDFHLNSQRFNDIMPKQPLWKKGDAMKLFPFAA